MKYTYIADLLKISLLGASPETKVFFIRLLNKYETEEVIASKSIDLSKDLGVSLNMVTKSLRYLVDNHYLYKISTTSEKGGKVFSYAFRFQNSEELFNLSPPMNKKNKAIFDLGIEHEKLLRSILISNNQVNEDASPGQTLNLSNRLLLATLIGFSDQGGVTRDLGMADLSAITGMSRDRLQTQIDKLIDLQFIRTTVSGITGKYLFGLSKGAYYLDLYHESFELQSPPRVLIVCRFNEIPPLPYYKAEAFKIFKISNNIAGIKKEEIKINNLVNLPLPDRLFNDISGIGGFSSSKIIIPHITKQALQIFEVFSKHRTQKLMEYLQYKIYQYASYILTNLWGDIGQIEPEFRLELMNIIKTELLSASLKNNRLDLQLDEKQKTILYDFIANVSYGLALTLHEFILPRVAPDDECYGIEIIPPPFNGGIRDYLAIEFIGTSEKYSSQIFKLSACTKQAMPIQHLSGEDKYKFGLATKIVRNNSFDFTANTLIPE